MDGLTAGGPPGGGFSRLWAPPARFCHNYYSDLAIRPESASGSNKPCLVDLVRRYTNRCDLLEQLIKAQRIVGEVDVSAVRPGVETVASRSRWLRDRLSAGDLNRMVELYRNGETAQAVADRFGVGVRAVKRLMRSRGVRKYQVTGR